MNKKLILTTSLIMGLMGAGCTQTTNLPPTNQSTTNATHDHMDMGMQMTSTDQVIDAGSRLITDKQSSDLKVGTNEYHFKLYDKKNQELTPENLQTVHDKKIHFLIAKDDLTVFAHVHPEYQNDMWNVELFIPKDGTYYTYTDITPTTEEPNVFFNTLLIGRATTTPLLYPAVSPNMSATSGSLKAVASSPHLMAGMPAEITFTLTENNSPITDIAPYLGAYGHVIALRHDDPHTFLHLHPSTETKPTNGQISFNATFSKPGRYTLFAEFNIHNTVHTFPITIELVDNMPSHQ